MAGHAYAGIWLRHGAHVNARFRSQPEAMPMSGRLADSYTVLKIAASATILHRLSSRSRGNTHPSVELLAAGKLF